jgi:hypothetical protein
MSEVNSVGQPNNSEPLEVKVGLDPAVWRGSGTFRDPFEYLTFEFGQGYQDQRDIIYFRYEGADLKKRISNDWPSSSKPVVFKFEGELKDIILNSQSELDRFEDNEHINASMSRILYNAAEYSSKREKKHVASGGKLSRLGWVLMISGLFIDPLISITGFLVNTSSIWKKYVHSVRSEKYELIRKLALCSSVELSEE